MEEVTIGVAPAGGGARFAAGDCIAGRYTVQCLLGRGGMGEVYQVVDHQLGEAVALKVLSTVLADDAGALARFQSEVKHARRIAHGNVCRTFELGTHTDDRGTVHFLTMELLLGETLDARLRRGPIARDELLVIIEQIARAVDAAHAAGVVHRDLKPSNIMLTPPAAGGAPRAVVTDFGLARRIDESRVTGAGWVGTPSYVAPEQIDGDPGGPAADIYAFGVLLFRAVTGRLPFGTSSADLAGLQRLTLEAPSARRIDPTVPPAWDRTIAACLQRRPEDRLTSAGAVVAALHGDAPVPVPAATRRRRRRWATAAIATLLLLVVAVVVARRPQGTRASGGVAAVDRIVSVEVVRGEGGAPLALPAEAPIFEDAAAWVLADEWRRLEEPRRFRVVAGAPGDLVARVTWRPDGEGVAARLDVGRAGQMAPAGEAHAGSIRDAARALYPRLATFAGEGRAGVELFPEEAEEMRSLAAPSPDAYRRFVAAFDEAWRTTRAPFAAYLARTDELLARYPDWAQLAVLRIRDAGLGSDTARRVLAAHLPPARKSGRDPVGVAILETIDDMTDRTIPATVRRELVGDRLNRITLLWSWDESSSALAVFDELARRFPHLQFGAWRSMILDHFGRDVEALDALREALRRAPGQEQCWLALASRAAARGDRAAERALADAIMLLAGRRGEAGLELAQLKLATFDHVEAAGIAERLLLEPPHVSVVALLVLADVAVMTGRFAHAGDYLLKAWQRAHGAADATYFPYVQIAREQQRLAELRGTREDATRWRTEALAQMAARGWSQSWRVALDYEQEQARTGRCPDRRRYVDRVADELARRDTAVLVTRAAARAGCADCAAVLAAGEARDEATLPWTIELARCAVARRTQLEQAARVLARPIGRFVIWGPTAVDTVLGKYWMGRVLLAKGDAAGARDQFEQFLAFWGAADLALPEIADARRRIGARP